MGVPLWCHRQSLGYGFDLLQQLLVAPVGVGQPILVQVHQLAESFDLGLEGEVLCPGVVSGVLTGFREVAIRVTSGFTSSRMATNAAVCLGPYQAPLAP